jgi:hypothetical protein
MGAAVATSTAPTQSPPEPSPLVLFFFKENSVGAGRRQPHSAILINPGDQSLADIMMMPGVTSLAAVRLDELDTIAFDMIDSADMDAISADNLGMFLDAAQINHHIAPVPEMTGTERPAPAQVALIH